jgi:hypothetical protein
MKSVLDASGHRFFFERLYHNRSTPEGLHRAARDLGDQDVSQSREAFATVTGIDQSIVDNADHLVSRIWHFAVRLLQLTKSSFLVQQSGKRPISL